MTTTGTGIALSGGAASVIGTSTFTGLTPALSVTVATGATFSGNTVDKCGIATTEPSTIEVASTAGLLVFNNKITNSAYYIVNAAANGNLVTAMLNTFKGNAKGAASVGGLMLLTHNYWSGETVPTTTATVSYDNPLAIAQTSGSIAVGVNALDAIATAGVKVATVTGAATTVGAALLSASPISIALPTTVTAKTYYDVFAVGTAITANIQFNGTTAKPVAATDMVYMYNAAFGRWDAVARTAANAYGNYVTITGADVSGTVYALVTVIPTVAPPTSTVSVQYPANGAADVPVDATFTWPAVNGATGYQFAIAQDNPDLTNKFAVLDYSANTPTNAEKLQEVLLYDTTYWWEVRSVSGTAAAPIYSAWSIVSFFTTEKAPVTTSVTTTSAPPPVTIIQTSIVVTQPPATTITITNPPAEKTQPIPSYLLWAVIAVGAVLVIAVIVLIVRTRRMP